MARFGVLSDKIATLIQSAATLVMIVYSRKIFTNYEFESKYFKNIFTIFIVYGFILIIRGIELDYQQFKFYVQNDFVFWPFIIPLAIFFNKDDLSLFYLIKSFYILGVIFLAISILDSTLVKERITAELFIQPFAFTCCFLFLNAKYLSKKITLVAFISLVVGVLSFIYLARRNAIISYGAPLMLGLYFILRNLNAAKFFRLFPLLIGLSALILSDLDLLPTSLTSKLNDRLTENSRSYVYENFFKGMEGHMLLGKGMNGTYYSPIDEQTTDDGVTFVEVQYRNAIETGYLQLILNGGYIYLALFLLILVPAAYLGIFKSTNHLSVAFGCTILLWLVDMAAYGLPRMLLQYLLVWISAGFCYKRSFRHKSDEEIAESFKAVGLA